MEIRDKIIQFVVEEIGVKKENIKDDSRLEDLGMDSLDQVEFIMRIEEEYDVEVLDTDAEKVKTIKDAIKLTETYVNGVDR